MAGSPINPRARLSIELAVTANSVSPSLLAEQEEAGRALGMTGAEMDVARRGSSFDFHTSIAVALALNACRETRQRARDAGFSEGACDEIERIALSLRALAA